VATVQAAPPSDPAKQSAKRRKLHTYVGPAPSVEQIEAEFWRIVETPDAVYEALYGQARLLGLQSVDTQVV